MWDSALFWCVRQERISIRGSIHPTVRPSVRRSVGPSVGMTISPPKRSKFLERFCIQPRWCLVLNQTLFRIVHIYLMYMWRTSLPPKSIHSETQSIRIFAPSGLFLFTHLGVSELQSSHYNNQVLQVFSKFSGPPSSHHVCLDQVRGSSLVSHRPSPAHDFQAIGHS